MCTSVGLLIENRTHLPLKRSVMAHFCTISLCLFGMVVAFVNGIFLSNLNATCFRCICEASTGCSTPTTCRQSYCGPFSISRAYWMDAGRTVLPNDEPTRWGAFEDCANDYECATGIVTQYMEKYGTDCNGDGLVDCVDYTMLHVNGGPHCHGALSGTFASRFFQCMRQRKLRA